MREKAWFILVAVIFSAAAPAFAAKTILYYENECCRNITQGEFAILFCQALGLREPAQGWTVQSAAAALTTSGHQPKGGWGLSSVLTEADMSGLLRNSKFDRKPFNQAEFRRSRKPVTIANARTAAPSDEAISQGEFAVLLVRALNLPPPGNPSPFEAASILASRPIPVKPLAGWQVDQPLREAEMLEILASTPIRASSVDPTAGISALQAYSLLLGKFEIATQGHFALYIVEALNIRPPAGRWTIKSALERVGKEFGVGGGYGMHPNVPLCGDFFVNSLRDILLKTGQPPGAPPQARGPFALLRMLRRAAGPAAGFEPPGLVSALPVSLDFGPLQRSSSSQSRGKDVDAFIRDVRESGLLPSNKCEPVAAQGFSKAAQGPIGPATTPVPPPAATPQPAPAATSSVPPVQQQR